MEEVTGKEDDDIRWTYRTVRACSSMGAPERTAAGRTSPSSLPSITRFGTGVKVLGIPSQQTSSLLPIPPLSLSSCV